MASTSPYLWPQESLNYLLNVAPKSAVFPSTNYVGLFSTVWSTVEGYGYTNTNITLNSGTFPISEISGTGAGGYNRIAVTSGNWGAPVMGTTSIGVNTIYVQQSTYNTPLTFTCASGQWTAVNGMFIASWATADGASNPAIGNIVYWYAPFADLQPITLSSGDSLAVTPTWQSAPYPA